MLEAIVVNILLKHAKTNRSFSFPDIAKIKNCSSSGVENPLGTG